jgi:hypothetical protein
MIRLASFFILLGVVVWAPWLSFKTGEASPAGTVLATFGALPASCFDENGEKLSEGFATRWYPMGRLVHTCKGDFVVWFWGGVQELGGIYKDARSVVQKGTALTCDTVLARISTRHATSTDPTTRIASSTEERATSLDFSLFPQAKDHETPLKEALEKGAVFAGKFAVASWECGSLCKRYAVVDVATGRVIAYDVSAQYGATFSLESPVFITDAKENIPPLPESEYEAESVALSLARTSRNFYLLTRDALSGTDYLERVCVESATQDIVEVEDTRITSVPNES